MHLIQIGAQFFSARRGYFGGLTDRANATRFSLQDAQDRAQRTAGATVVSETAAQADEAQARYTALQSNQIA